MSLPHPSRTSKEWQGAHHNRPRRMEGSDAAIDVEPGPAAGIESERKSNARLISLKEL